MGRESHSRLLHWFSLQYVSLISIKILLIILQAHNSITKYEKGYYLQKDFTAKECQKYFKYYLDKLKGWQRYTTTKSDSRAAEKFRKELWRTLR